MKLEAIGNVKVNGIYRMPGTIFEIDEKEGKRLIDLGVATASLSGEMIEAAKNQFKKVEKQRNEIAKEIEAAQAKNGEIEKQIAEIKAMIAKVQDPAKKEKLESKAQKLTGNKVDTKTLQDKLNNLDKELAEIPIK